MRQIQKIILVFCLLLKVGLFATADEGMWMPHQIKGLNLETLGLAIDPDELYKKDGTGLMSAVVYLGGGTGEFVSPDGLILTNHHVAFGALQRASSKENDYIRNGFIAWARGEEIQAKGYIADVLLGYEEITDKILSRVDVDMTPRDRYEALDQAKKRIIAEEERRGQDIRATVATMYSGNQYYLFRFKRIKDIRLVLAPPQDLGNFGGDIDNWMWPRHTCDFSFLRAYVSKENIGVDYSPDNIPYKPKAFLKISLDGFKEGDFSFVMGYPGRTYRNHTVAELEADLARMKERINIYKDIIGFLEEAGRGSREIQIKYASAVQGLNNALKNYQGKIEGMAKISLVDKKKADERQFLDWVGQDPARRRKYGTVLQDIADFIENSSSHRKKVILLGGLTSSYFGSALLSQAYTVFRTVQERQKPDMERDPSFQERQLPYIKMQIELAERRYDLDVDRTYLKHQLKRLLDLTEEERPSAFRELLGQKSEEAIHSFVDDLYRRTSLTDSKKRLEMIELTPQALAELGDPMIALAEDLEKEMKDLREEGKALDQVHLDLRRVYLEALLEMTAAHSA